MANVVAKKMVYDVEFELSFVSDDKHEAERNLPPLEFHRDVTLEEEETKSFGLRKALQENLEKFFAGINEFPREYVRVGIRKFQERSA